MSSSTSITEPSLMTKPSRPRSNGRQAFSGSSLRSLVALIWQNAPMVSGVIVASEPPASMATASPRLMIADAVRAGRAGADNCVVRAAGVRVDCDDPGCHVRDHHRDRKGADPLRPALHQLGMALLDLFHAADTRADDHAHIVGNHPGRNQE